MRIALPKESLDTAIASVSATVDTQSETFSHILFTLSDGNLTVKSVSNRVYSTAPVAGVRVIDGGDTSWTMEAWRVKAFLGACEKGEIELSFSEGTVSVKAGRGTQKFQSLDPNTFPSWEGVRKESISKGKVEAKAFKRALEISAQFIHTNDDSLCVIDVKGGKLQSTDRVSMCTLTVEGLNGTFKVHSRDVKPLTAFLGKCTTVEVLEHDKAVFFQDESGAVFGEARYALEFPSITFTPPTIKPHWEIERSDLAVALAFLKAGAPKDCDKVTFTGGSGLMVSMASQAGGESVCPLKPLHCDEAWARTVTLNLSHLEKVLSFKDVGVVFMTHVDRGSLGTTVIDLGSNGAEGCVVMVWPR